jgi:colicin import membrane protein
MNLAASRDDLAAALLAAGVHGFFLLLLVIGVSWQIHDPQPIMAELWQALPEMAKPVPAPEPPPSPAPELKPEPVLKPEPKPLPKAEPDTRAADIALEKKKLAEKKKQEELLMQKQAVEVEKKKQRQEAEKRRREEARLMELEAEQEAARLETDKLKREQEKKLAEQKRREELKREEEEMERSLLEESLNQEANQAKAREAKVAADRRAAEIGKIVDRYKAMISDKVRGNTRLPENLSGNPEVVYAVNVLPTGEIIKIKLVKSSGNTAYDQAVEKAIGKSSPLPVPSDREAAQHFRELELKHKPKN